MAQRLYNAVNAPDAPAQQHSTIHAPNTPAQQHSTDSSASQPQQDATLTLRQQSDAAHQHHAHNCTHWLHRIGKVVQPIYPSSYP